MEGTIIVRDGMRVAGIAISPIKASVNFSEIRKSEGVASFERFVSNDVSICGFVVAVVGSSGGVSVGHLSG